jgi:hypothetical protein
MSAIEGRQNCSRDDPAAAQMGKKRKKMRRVGSGGGIAESKETLIKS